MTAALAVESYPRRYLEIAEKFQTGKTRRLFILCASEGDARRLRFDLYGFRRALQRANLMAEYSEFFAVRLFVKGKRLTLIHADAQAAKLKIKE